MIDKKKNKGIKYWIGRIHLWLGLASGLLVCFLGITGCILAFEKEIENVTQPYRNLTAINKPLLPPTKLKEIADEALPNKHAHSVTYQPGKAAQVVYYNFDPEYYYIVFVNQYSGEVIKVKNMNDDFFRIVILGHYYLWLPPAIGQPILTTATLLFVILLISGLILWWPKSKAASKQRFSIKWNAKWRRVNYDFHNVMGFYITWIIIFIALSGMVMGFQWFANSVYFVGSGGKSLVPFTETYSDTTKNGLKLNATAADIIWNNYLVADPAFKGSIDVHVPEDAKASIEVAKNPDPDTYWKSDYRYFDQHTLKEIEVNHVFGKFKNAKLADKIMRMNYDIHVGAVGGIAGKVIAFLASLVAASMPITGVLIWIGRTKKKRKSKSANGIKT
ncbi:PepSY-associated TM helix domain-containing protein [Pedobacter sandarakinus]|uniref:PepSY-associated TM helix domain-containing protein n=1 Tax=Pedobacter sandarakinus TaxID=353156 RepID=UPI002245DAA1|nr:PepSY-associated TM helix domain-containing protein [Pedobacter sandarakinus]MCX2576080.1 PepSY-associated TM helix domain-containing protein [Pedobacter sandarakinus]